MPVVESVGLAAPIRSGMAVRIEAEMMAALKKEQAKGVTDPKVLRAAVLDAHDKAKAKAKG